jgi:hypothetical protein
MILHELSDLGRMPEIRNLPVRAAVLAINRSHIRVAQADRRLDQRIKHTLQIECRAADDFEHVGGSRLLLQRFAQLVQQASVLDGDDGLVREVGD